MNEKDKFKIMMAHQMVSYMSYFFTSSLLFYLSVALPVAWLIFFVPNLMNVIAIGLLFPGIAALVSCSIKFKESKDKTTFKVMTYFVEGYQKNFKDTIKYCFLYAVIIFVVMLNMNYYGANMPMLMGIALFTLTTLSTLVVTYMMIIATKFQFKTKNLLKVSIYCILMHFKRTIKIFILYVILFFVSPWMGAFTLFLLVSPIIYLFISFVHPVLEDVYEKFVEKPE